ncbi:MAG: septal ring lytic transglycosylase RlpA family protein [Alphaproteobacteria bacterium]|nr:septal ring lytic transglycosylase RlpA family protein [Alphaproteobacteria bacterium]
MKRFITLFALSILVTACSGTKDYGDAPGFRNGKATHPLVKIGKPYEINGTTYYPEYDPEYKETGMASWYGPGFHGKSTANGETFNKYEMTAAHRTLPIPSIVKVTNVKNGKTAIVRINDRGPFAHGRIIDLSKLAAERLDMIRSGVAKVKVEYMPQESRRYIALLEQGRSPSNINVERDVLIGETSFASASEAFDTPQQKKERSWFDLLNPISAAQAEEPKASTKGEVIPVETKTTQDLPPLDGAPPAKLPPTQQSAPVAEVQRSPFDLVPQTQKIEDPKIPDKPVVQGGYMLQLGVFGNEANALNLKRKFDGISDVEITTIQLGGRTLHRVRAGPYRDEMAARDIQQRARTMGVLDTKIVKL